MTAPFGEGVADRSGFSMLSKPLQPTYELLEPRTAPADLLDHVRVTPGHSLEAETPHGNVTFELNWKSNNKLGAENYRGDFFPALGSEGSSMDAESTSSAMHRYPYIVLPDGAFYTMIVGAPRGLIDKKWSEPQAGPVGTELDLSGSGVHVADFRRAYPDVKTDELP